MKLTIPALILAGTVLAAASGCGSKNTPPDAAQTPAPASQSLPPGSQGPMAPAASSVDVTQVPTTTKIDGKTVPLKSMPDGLKYYDIKIGTGASPKPGQTASVQYTGTLLDGTKFDSSYDHPGGAPFDFSPGAGQVIKGWDEGVPTMKVGGTRRLVVPGGLAYGPDSPTPAIPPNATLVFDIELVGVK